jgi:hypothetical protein
MRLHFTHAGYKASTWLNRNSHICMSRWRLDSFVGCSQTEETSPVWYCWIGLHNLSIRPEDEHCGADRESFFDLFVFLWQPPGAVVCLGFRTIILYRHLSSAKGFSHGEVGLPAGHSSKEMLSHVTCPQTMHGQVGIFLFGLRRQVLYRRSILNLSHLTNKHKLVKTHS